jgi:NAD(P)-dependent dehydrogenase (short-subunit alcohol dehydrogenase family)
MKRRGGGKVINMASVAGLEPQAMMGVYSVSKAAVLMLTKVLAAELAHLNIQVNAIAPGFVKTKFSSILWQTPQINEAILKRIPQKRMAEPDEIAGLAVYLASPASSFVTGSTFTVDGGQLVGAPIEF